jgi:hypothetical protein
VRVNRRQLNNNPNQNASNRKPKGRKPGSANGKRPVKKAPVTGADLDKDLDTCTLLSFDISLLSLFLTSFFFFEK